MAVASRYEYILSLNDRMSGALRRAGVQGETTYDRLQRRQERLNNTARKFGAMIGGVFAATAIFNFGKKIVTAGMDIEQTRIAFGTFMGDIKKGNEMIRSLNEFANVTPYNNEEVLAAGRQFLAAQIPAEKVIDTLTMVGDVASGAKIPLNDLAQIYSKAMNKGRVQAEELNQLAERGVPILATFAKMYGKTTAEVMKMGEKGVLTSAELTKAFGVMTAEGGMYYNMMQKQSESSAGRWSTFLGKMQLVFMKWGEMAGGAVKSVIEKLIVFADWIYKNAEGIARTFQSIIAPILKVLGIIGSTIIWTIRQIVALFDWFKRHQDVLATLVIVVGSLTLAYYALRAAAIANAAIMKITTLLALEQALAGRSLTIAQGLAAIATKGFTGAMKALNITFLASPIFWITAAIIGLIAAISYVIYKTDGWGKMWKHTVAGAKLIWQAYTDFVKAYFTTMIDGIIIAINKVMVAFYRAKQAVGMGDSKKNQEQIDKFNADTEERKNNIKGAWTKVGDTTKAAAEQFKLAGQSLTWNNDKKIGDVLKGVKKALGMSTDETASADPNNTDGLLSAGTTSADADITKTVADTSKGITSGGSRPTNITINLNNLVEQITITPSTVRESAGEIERHVREALLRALNSANGVAYGN